MKHYTDFLTHKTNTTKQLGKLANSLVYSIKEKQLQLQALKQSLKNVEKEIDTKIEPFYNNSAEYKEDLKASIKKAYIWNNEPLANRKPTKKTK